MNFVIFFFQNDLKEIGISSLIFFVSNEEFPLPKKIAKVQFLALLKNRRRIRVTFF